VQLLKDRNGREIRLTNERLNHILEHPEMESQESRIVETLLTPDSIIASHHDATVHFITSGIMKLQSLKNI